MNVWIDSLSSFSTTACAVNAAQKVQNKLINTSRATKNPSRLTCVILLAAWLLKAGSQNLFVLCSFWWTSVRSSYLHFECFTVEEQTVAKKSKNNHRKLQNKDTVHRIISYLNYAALKSLQKKSLEQVNLGALYVKHMKKKKKKLNDKKQWEWMSVGQIR